MLCLYRVIISLALLFHFTCNCYADKITKQDIIRQIVGYDKCTRPTKEIDENILIFKDSVRKCNGRGEKVYFFLKKLWFVTFGPYLNYLYYKFNNKKMSFYENEDYIKNQKKIDEYNKKYVLYDFISSFIDGNGYDNISAEDIAKFTNEKKKFSEGVDEIGLSLNLLEWIKGERESVDDICRDLSTVEKKDIDKLYSKLQGVLSLENDCLSFFFPEFLFPISEEIENFVFCDEDGNCKIDYPFSLPEGNEQYKISKERAHTIIIGNIVSLCLLGLVVFLLFFFKPVRFIYFSFQVLSILYFLLFQYKDVKIFLSILIFLFFVWLTKYTGGKNKFFFGVSLFFLVSLSIFGIVIFCRVGLMLIIQYLTGFFEEIEIYFRIDDRDSIVRDYIKKTWKIYKTIKANDVLKRAFKNEFKELDSVFGLEKIDFNKEVNLSQYDMARNAMLEQSCKLLTHRYSSEKPLVDLRKYMDLDKDFSTLVKTCKRDIIKMFVVGKKLSAYLSIFMRKKGNNKK